MQEYMTLESLDHWNGQGFDASGVAVEGTVTVPSDLFDKLLITAKVQCNVSVEHWNKVADSFLRAGNADGLAAQEHAQRWEANLEVIEDLFDATR